MGGPALESLLKRDRYVVLSALFLLTALAWAYVLWLSAAMPARMPSMPDMPGMVMAPEIKPWTMPQFLLTLAMWAVMMVGMMIPSAAPMILLYAVVGRQALQSGKVFASTSWF